MAERIANRKPQSKNTFSLFEEHREASEAEMVCTWTRASLVVQLVKNPPAMRETWVRSLGWGDPLEK